MNGLDSRIIGGMGAGIGDIGDIGDLLGELLDGLDGDDGLDGLDDGFIGEIGRRKRHKRKKLAKLQRKLGVANAARAQALQMRQAQAEMTGQPWSAGGYQLAVSDQRELYLPFNVPSLAAAAGSAATLVATVQRPMQLHRIIVAVTDVTTGADQLQSVTVDSVLVGVDPVFNAQGSAPGVAFAYNAVGVKLLTFPARVGSQVSILVTRRGATTNAGVASAFAIGVSAQQ